MRRGIALLGLAAFAAGCVTAPEPSPVENTVATWHSRQEELKPVTTWKIQGRLAMRADEEGWQASVNWVRKGERHRLDITGPLGRGHLRLEQDSHGAEMRDADQRTWRAENAEQLLYRATGWLLPIDGMSYWVRGLPSPTVAASEELDGQGRLKTLVQSGWDIQFLEYTRYGSLDLPSKLFIKSQRGDKKEITAKNAALEVRLVIERWALD